MSKSATTSPVGKRKTGDTIAQPAIPNEPITVIRKLNGTSWFAQGLGGVFYPNGPDKSGNDLDVPGFSISHIPVNIDGGEAVSSTDVTEPNGWDVPEQLFASIPSLSPRESSQPSAAMIEALLAKEVAITHKGAGGSPDFANEWEIPTSTPFTDSSTANNSADLEDASSSGALSWQLMGLSFKITQANRRLASPSSQPPTMSSPQVTEALECTNTLIHLFNTITTTASSPEKISAIAPMISTSSIAPNATDNSVILLALASHQHLIPYLRLSGTPCAAAWIP
ncbi:Fujikurins biosynthesis cluster transcription factor [Paramyrothecium foliicola]|nr:Fujikurins biosynthesis cluster transcription factor [Paramyrothecium foliicola]